MSRVNNLSPLFMTAVFKDEFSQSVVPTTVEWRLDDITADEEVLDWQSLTPGSSVSWVIAGQYNTIQDTNNLKEVRSVTVRIDEGLQSQAFQEHRYEVLNRAPTVEQ